MTEPHDTWPQALREHLRRAHGEPLSVEPIAGGLSGNPVQRVRFADTSLVLKGRVPPRETFFYEALAPSLEPRGLRTPRLEWSGEGWLVLEDIPDPLPRGRWLADPAVLAALRALHLAGPVEGIPDPYRPAWPPGLTDVALAAYPRATASRLRAPLAAVRLACLPLLEPRCLISGDPNPTNWGVRASAAAVLYDWGRLGLGTPALDLAITVPGWGGAEAFGRVAGVYLGLEGGPAVERLASEVGAAKAWSVVEFLGLVAGGTVEGEGVGTLAESAMAWLARFGDA